MIVQVFYNDVLKEYYFQNILDGRHQFVFYPEETGFKENIEFYIDINNGIRRVNGKNIVSVRDNHSNEIEPVLEVDRMTLVSIRNYQSSIGILVFENDENITNFKKYIVDSPYVEIGMGGNIQYYSDNNISRYFAVSYENSKAYVTPYINRIYHNGKLINEKVRVRFGDVISYKKFKLIYLGNVLAVNNPDKRVSSTLEEFKYRPPLDVQASIAVDEDFEQKNIFTRSPRITHKLVEETIEIDPPTNKKETKDKPLIYTIGPSLTMSLAMLVNVVFMITANSSGRSPIPSAVMAASMLTGAILWPILSRRYNRKQILEDEENRVTKYKEYIDGIDKKLGEKADYNRRVYDEIYPSLEMLIQSALKKDRNLWNHIPGEEGFLDLRIGRGARKFSVNVNIQKERFTLEDDPLRKYASVIQNKYMYLNNVPVSVDLLHSSILGVVGTRNRQLDLLKLLITRLAITHCYDEVKIALIFDQKNEDMWEFAKWLPHFWSDNRKNRLMACDRDGTFRVMSYLKGVYEDRLNAEKGASILPRYIVFVTDYDLVSRDSGIKNFIESSGDKGFTFVLGYDNIGLLPSNCQNIIQVSDKECTMYNKADNSGKMFSFIPDICQGADVKKISETLASVRVSKVTEETSVPERLSFMGLYKARNVDDLVISRRWNESQSYKSLEAPIGIGSGDEVFSLNIHEKFHGPHGLIAGTTGSGKSEFIQSLILSMAINYHPYDVSFVLIDYKGGGMANAFVNLPHVSGTITNLDGNLIKRSLISLKSELKRRQGIFKEYGVNHIDSYQMKYKKGLAEEPLPHLIIVSDEFAELKSQEPEFMNELISTARIGRSLGVHLILATQKPSGVVNDQIWSNTRFRICLKVADKTDSKEMLKREEAAFITLPGRCYVQIGNDEIFKLIQSGYSGEKYIRNGSNLSDDNNVSISCIDLQGNELYKTSSKINKSDSEETQLSAIVDYISEYSKSQGIKPLQLWLPPLPKEIYLYDIDKRPGGFDGRVWQPCEEWLDPIIGMYDEPERQYQGILDLNIGANGHFILYGAPGTGKTTFLQTLICSMARRYSPEIVNFYVMDFGSRSLGYTKFLPHTADVMFSDDEDKIKKLFQRIADELSVRKKALAEYGVGNLVSYMQASGRVLPAVMLVIDNFAAFIELYAEYEGELIKLSREGGNYGIFLIITSASVNAVKRRIVENIKSCYTLQLNDVFDYAAVLGRTEGVFPDNVKGRGIVKFGAAMEYQTALAVKAVNEADRVKLVREEFTAMADAWTGPVPRPLPVMPENMDLSSIMLTDDYVSAINSKQIPIGYDVESIELVCFDMVRDSILNISGDAKSGKTNFLAGVIKANKYSEIWAIDNETATLATICKGCQMAKYSKCDTDSINAIIEELVTLAVGRFNEYKAYSDNGGEKNRKEFFKDYSSVLFIIDDFDTFFSSVGDTEFAKFKHVVKQIVLGLGIYIISTVDTKMSVKLKSQCPDILTMQTGLVLGSIDNLSYYNITVSYSEKKNFKQEPGKGFYVVSGDYSIVRIPFVEE